MAADAEISDGGPRLVTLPINPPVAPPVNAAVNKAMRARDNATDGQPDTLRGPLATLLLPALAATGLVTALAALGFALGSLYGDLAPPRAPALAALAADTRSEDAVGGPEETLGTPLAIPLAMSMTPTTTPTTTPATTAAVALGGTVPGNLAVAAAARTGIIERDLANGQDPARPVFWPVVGGWVSSGYGKRLDPFTGQQALHRGMDFAGLQNSTILAAGAGVVTWSGDRPGYGNLIEIDHGNGYVSRYGHNASNLVAVGDYVKAGQVIALMGATGRAKGNHLHFEILRDGRHVNPARLVQRGS